MSKRAEEAQASAILPESIISYAKEHTVLAGLVYREGVKYGYVQAEKDTIERVVSWLIKNVNYYIGSMEVSRCLPIKYHVSCACWADLKAFMEEDNG